MVTVPLEVPVKPYSGQNPKKRAKYLEAVENAQRISATSMKS